MQFLYIKLKKLHNTNTKQMVKPLLRILPSLSGNVKLACSLSDIVPVSSDSKMWEANVRGAKLHPIASQLYQKNIDASLIASTWEYDLPKFYKAYSDVFYKTCFEYNKDDMLKLDRRTLQYVRATDFEWGVKRVSYSKSGSQFAFFAPLYIDSADCLPSYFLINMTLYSVNSGGKMTYAVKKSLRVNIGLNGNDKRNYLYGYLQRYASKIDDNVAFCTPLTNQATYYGIDLQRSGFVTAVDNMMEKIYRKQNTIQNFDANIVLAFERNRIAMKQIIPLCFYFSANDVLTDAEKLRYRNCKVEFDGAYYDCRGNKLSTYDFLTDYVDYAESILRMNPFTGVLQWSAGEESNLMDVGFPSLNDKRYIKYIYANKLAPWICRWKLKYSDDDHPYVINNSWAFSRNQDSNYRYAQFPSNFHSMMGLANYFKIGENYNYNMMFPVGDAGSATSGRHLYMYAGAAPGDGEETPTGPFNYLVDLYRRIIEQYCSNWFSVVDNYSESIYGDESIWRDTKDGCVYYKGMLYNLRNVYNMTEDAEEVDKFAVIVSPQIHVFNEEDIADLQFSRYSLYRQAVSQVSNANAVANDSLLPLARIESKSNYLFDNDEFDTGGKVNQDTIKFSEIFKEDPEGTFIDGSSTSYSVAVGDYTYYGRYDLDYYKLNKYYAAYDMLQIVAHIKKSVESIYKSEDAECRAMINAYVKPNYGDWTKSDFASSVADHITYAYVMVDIARFDTLSYHDLEIDPETWEAYNINDSADYATWQKTHNETIMNVPSSYAGRVYSYTYDGRKQESTLFDILAQNSYVRHASIDASYMLPMKTTLEYNGTYHSYLSIYNSKYNSVSYGTQYYFGSYLVKSTYIPYAESGFDAYNCLKGAYADDCSYVDDKSLLCDWKNQKKTHPAVYWAARLGDFKARAAAVVHDSIAESQSNIYEYEYVPVLENSGTIYAENIFIERSSWTGHFYGDVILQSNLKEDNDVLWADPYNFKAIFAYEGMKFPDNAVTKDMYVKFLNKMHLFYWYIELYKDKDRKYDGSESFNDFLQNEWYKHLYVAEKKMVYDYGRNAVPQCRIIYTPLEKLLQFPEYYNSSYDESTYSSAAEDPYRSFITFYNKLEYNIEEDLFTLPGFFDSSMSPYDYLRFRAGDGSIIVDTDVSDPNPEHQSYLISEAMVPIVERGQYGHRYERTTYSYTDPGTGLHAYHYEPIKFELVYRKEMYRVDEALWSATHMSSNIDNYRDLYFYRLRSMLEHDVKLSSYGIPVEFVSDLSYIHADLSQIDSYTYIDVTQGIRYEDSTPVAYNIYNYQVGYYGSPRKLTGNPWSYIQQCDSMLVPMFDDVFIQPSSEALIYTHYSLHDINKVSVVEDALSASGENKVITKNYRFNTPNKLLMIELSPEEIEEYGIQTRYKKYAECYYDLNVMSDDLNYGKYGLSTYKSEDGTTYGFYYINSYLNNTADTFNITGIADSDIVPGIKYINFINGVNIKEYPEYVAAIYPQLLPFIRQQPLNALSEVNTLVYPKTYPIDLIYSPKIANRNNGSNETEIILNDSKLRTMSLLRYFHAITPIIVPTTQIQNEWRLKLKSANASMIDTGNYQSIGDSVIYRTPVHIGRFTPYNIYAPSDNELEMKSFNNVVEQYTPLERKFYNNSSMLNLEPHFEVNVPGKLTYEELLSKETESYVFEQFTKRVNGRIRDKFSYDDLKHIYSKYEVSYDSQPAGLDMMKQNKLYALTIKFDLL